MITIYDIAKKTGFSISTVSKVLNKRSDVSEKTKKIINEAVTELGIYRVQMLVLFQLRNHGRLGLYLSKMLEMVLSILFLMQLLKTSRKRLKLKAMIYYSHQGKLVKKSDRI